MAAPAQHPSCYHVGYSLSCNEYDDLIRIASGCCRLCSTPTTPLYIDHDHTLGNWAVRGLVCHRCNQSLRHVEAGNRPPTVEVTNYLNSAWHLTQAASQVKAARVRAKVPCPTCGRSTSVHGNGNLHRHWSRLPGQRNEMCPGVELPDRPPAA